MFTVYPAPGRAKYSLCVLIVTKLGQRTVNHMTTADKIRETTGHWSIYVAGPPIGWDTTVLGVAIYNPDGELTYSRFADIEKAIERGDWDRDWTTPEFAAPPTWQEMEQTLGRTGNFMAHLRWHGDNQATRWDTKTGDFLFDSVVSGDTISKIVTRRDGRTPSRDIVEEIAHLVEVQPRMSDLTTETGDVEYLQVLADKIRKKFKSGDEQLRYDRAVAYAGASIIRDILEAMCENQGISTASPYYPDKPAPNYVLAQRLWIGRVFDIPDSDGTTPMFQLWAPNWNSEEDKSNLL